MALTAVSADAGAIPFEDEVLATKNGAAVEARAMDMDGDLDTVYTAHNANDVVILLNDDGRPERAASSLWHGHCDGDATAAEALEGWFGADLSGWP